MRKQYHLKISKKNKGFTLLETVVAMVILAAALLLLTNSWSASFLQVRKTQQNFEVSALLERKMTELDIEYRGKSLDEIPESRDGEFDGAPDFRWKMASKKLEIPDISSSLSAKDGGVDQMTMTLVKTLTETMSKSVKEVTVTIIYTKSKKPQEFSVTTYFVDFNKEVPFGLPGGG